MTGREHPLVQSTVSTASHKITIRYARELVGVDPLGFRIIWANGMTTRLYMVNAVLEGDLVVDGNDARGRWLTLLCTEVFDPQDPDQGEGKWPTRSP